MHLTRTNILYKLAGANDTGSTCLFAQTHTRSTYMHTYIAMPHVCEVSGRKASALNNWYLIDDCKCVSVQNWLQQVTIAAHSHRNSSSHPRYTCGFRCLKLYQLWRFLWSLLRDLARQGYLKDSCSFPLSRSILGQ
jgi:hypothetical protein